MITKEEMIQLANAQLRYEVARMEARKQYEQEVIQAIAWVRQTLPGQVYPPPAPAPGQPAGAQPGQAPPQGGKP